MNNVLKWILYVLLGLVILAVVVGIVFAVFGAFGGYAMMRPGIRMMAPYYRVYGGFSPLRGIFGGLIGLGIIVLIIIGIVALVSALVRGNRRAMYAPPTQPAAPAQTSVASPTRTCPNCGKPAMDDWKTCPYCGTTLT